MRLTSPLRSYRRWRHSRGFGIHSPFAYRFITDVLTQRLPYYGYADISRDPRIRLLFRLAARFQPAGVRIMSSQPALLEGAVRRAYSKALINNGKPDFIVVDDLDAPVNQNLKAIASASCALILNASDASRSGLKAALKDGMVFDNGRGTLVVIHRHGLPRQDFDVNF